MDDRNTLIIALDWVRQGRKVALATVVSTRGSAPRPEGARMAVDETGRFCGSVSSGCVEAEIIATAEKDAGIDGAMIVLGDMPDIAPSLMARMIEVFSAQGAAARKRIITPTRAGRRGHPVLWGRDFFPALLHETVGDSGGRDLIARHADAVISVEAESDAILKDLDTPQAYSHRLAVSRS